MFFKKILRWIWLTIVGILAFIIILLCVSIGPVDRTPIEDLHAFSEMQEKLKSITLPSLPRNPEGFSVGFAKVNITPSFKTATAGYGNRKGKLATAIKDSIFVRAIVVQNGVQKVAIVSADLLLIPPIVTQRLDDKLKSIGFSLDNTFLGATHTHNSIGNWAEGAIQFMYGRYNENVVEFLADKIVKSIADASKNLKKSKLKSGSIPIGSAVQNRLISGGPEDSLLRVVEVHREDSSKLLLMSFTAHATCLYSKDVEISPDYPGKLVDEIEKNGYSFAMFMAGAVGSHKPSAPKFGPECIDWMANEITSAFLVNKNLLTPIRDSSLVMLRVPLVLSDPQLKLTNSLKVRSWFFNAALGEFPVELKCLRVGNVLLLGTPCDFSGEFNPSLDAYAAKNNFHIIVTSFNGGYIGYLTPRTRYDIDHYETKLMNWYAPGTGEEVEGSLKYLINLAVKY
jgi:neutral ceramidase